MTNSKSTNIILCGVGGQGLVLTTKVIAEAAMYAGYDFKTTDVIGLAQRGGKVWGTVKISPERVYSPNIPQGTGHFMLATEPLEAFRWIEIMSTDNPIGHMFVNTKEISPTPVLLEKRDYPVDYLDALNSKCRVTSLNAFKKAKEFGTEKLANTLLVGMLASQMELPKSSWLKALRNNVPSKYLTHNEEGFEFGYSFI